MNIQARLNRYFKKHNRFTWDVELNGYVNNNWLITPLDEGYALSRLMKDRDVGAVWFEDVIDGDLTKIINYIRDERGNYYVKN